MGYRQLTFRELELPSTRIIDQFAGWVTMNGYHQVLPLLSTFVGTNQTDLYEVSVNLHLGGKKGDFSLIDGHGFGLK